MANNIKESFFVDTTETNSAYSTFGRHMVVDFWGVDYARLNNKLWLQQQLMEAATRCGASVLSVQSQQFQPQGVTVLVMLSESHISIHTYPEKEFAAVDCFTCGESVDPQVALAYLVEVMKPKSVMGRKLIRGLGDFGVEDVSEYEN